MEASNDLSSEPVYLPEKQYKIINVLVEAGEISIGEISASLGIRPEDLMRDLAELEAKGLVKIRRIVEEIPILTNEGHEVLVKGLPEERVYSVMYRCVEKPVKEFIECVALETGDEPGKVRIGLQHLLRHGCLRVRDGIVVVGDDSKCINAMEEAGWIRGFLKRVAENLEAGEKGNLLSISKRRKLVRVERRKKILVTATEKLQELYSKGLITTREVLTIVRPSHAPRLDEYLIKEFDLSIPPPRPEGARLNAYMEFLDLVRDILVSMGFIEAKGPHVELEFWNFDALFQAQDHPAREIHDTFFIETNYRGRVPEEFLERARRVHGRGWGYKWDPLRALRPVLRTQTTAVSVRKIAEMGEGEYRFFTLDRVFRPETLDAKHSMEFYQLDGIIVGRNVSFKDLLAFFKEFSAALGINKVWFKPAYFPFTEPSVEGFIKHPDLGWIEVYPGGVFRREVMEILGAPGVKAIAWGIGIDRLAMAVLGLDDIRDLFSRDIDFLKKLPVPRLPYFTRYTSSRDVEVLPAPD